MPLTVGRRNNYVGGTPVSKICKKNSGKRIYENRISGVNSFTSHPPPPISGPEFIQCLIRMRKIWKNVKNLEYFKIMFFLIYLLRDTTVGKNEWIVDLCSG